MNLRQRIIIGIVLKKTFTRFVTIPLTLAHVGIYALLSAVFIKYTLYVGSTITFYKRKKKPRKCQKFRVGKHLQLLHSIY